MNPVQRMKELIEQIRKADGEYFGNDDPRISDREYDALMEELRTLEMTTGVVFSDSPSRRVGGAVKETLKTVPHTKPMLSAKKTKSMDDLYRFAQGQNVMLSWKLDGLSLILRYADGRLTHAITRGSDGLLGEDVTHTVRKMRQVPLKVPYREPFEVRGEGVVSWVNFEELNKRAGDPVSHPRNLAAGAVRSVTAEVGKLSRMDFFAFELIEDAERHVTKADQLDFLATQGFVTVPHQRVEAYAGHEALRSALAAFRPKEYGYPVDGIVMEYDFLAYGKSLGATAHHERRLIAYKWQDELVETVFRGVDLITTRNGTVSVVGVFDPVTIDGATITRANLHNLGNFEKYRFGIGDRITVYKANMIIPQIAENLTKSGTYELPRYCPCCRCELTTKVSSRGTRELYCPNERCIARNAQKIARFCDKAAMNIEGLSAVTLEKLMAYGWVQTFADLYHLERHRAEIASTPGFGIHSYNKMVEAIDRSRTCSLDRFLVALGIPMLGPQAAQVLSEYYYGKFEEFEKALQERFPFSYIEGISEALERHIYAWYDNPHNEEEWRPLLQEIKITPAAVAERGASSGGFAGAHVVVTGTLTSFTRKEVSDVLRLMGAHPSESVSAKTDYLIVGVMPGAKKLSAAMKLGTKIITEAQFADMLGR